MQIFFIAKQVLLLTLKSVHQMMRREPQPKFRGYHAHVATARGRRRTLASRGHD